MKPTADDALLVTELTVQILLPILIRTDKLNAAFSVKCPCSVCYSYQYIFNDDNNYYYRSDKSQRIVSESAFAG